MTELSEKGVLVVVATARDDPSLFVELTNFAERQGYPATRRRHATQGPVICAFDRKLCDDDVSLIN
jgi:hypothetical protein